MGCSIIRTLLVSTSVAAGESSCSKPLHINREGVRGKSDARCFRVSSAVQGDERMEKTVSILNNVSGIVHKTNIHCCCCLLLVTCCTFCSCQHWLVWTSRKINSRHRRQRCSLRASLTGSCLSPCLFYMYVKQSSRTTTSRTATLKTNNTHARQQTTLSHTTTDYTHA